MIKYQITSQYIFWRIKKIIGNFLPCKSWRKKWQHSLPRKWDVISFSEKSMNEYSKLLKKYVDVLSPEDSLDLALEKKSFCRIGDGEFNIIIGHRNSFNDPDNKLAKRLIEICETGSTDNILVCQNNYKLSKEHPTYTWFVHHGTRYMQDVLNNVTFPKQKFADAYFLVRNQDNEGMNKIFSLWNGKKVLFVCNKKSPIIEDKLGFFKDVIQKEFLFVPNKNAFASYDEILANIKKFDKSWKIYLEAGATASVLAWDLAKEGYNAYDMGDFYKRTEVRISEAN